jgi:alcohol dehydrogenase class IV
MPVHHFLGTAIPRSIISGPGSRHEVVAELDKLAARRVVVISSARLKSDTTFVNELTARLGDRVVSVIDRVEANVPVGFAHRVSENVASLAPDAVVAIGGGAVHDLAKAIAVMVPSGRSIVDFVSRFEPPSTFHGADVDVEPLPVFTIPSTFSAADVVGGGAVTDTERGEKLIFVHPRLTPAAVFLDGDVVATTPQPILAASGMNAIHHCLEAYYSKGAQPITDAFAVAALRGLLRALPLIAPSRPTPSPEVFQDAIESASMSGLTYANSWLGIGHSVCHSLGGRYGLSHGLANSVMVLQSLRFNFMAARGRLAELARASGIARDVDDGSAAMALVARIDALADILGTPKSLSEIGLPTGQFEEIAKDVLGDPQTYWNPRPATQEEIVAWLESAW